jgi:hypothetical protein
MHLTEQPTDPRSVAPDRMIPSLLADVCLMALAKDPAHRFASATAMAQALSHATQGLPAEQWRPLSTRGGPRISAAGVGSVAQQPTTERQPTPDAFRSTAIAPTTEAKSKRTGLVVGLIAAAAIGTGIVLVAMSTSKKDDATPATATPTTIATPAPTTVATTTPPPPPATAPTAEHPSPTAPVAANTHKAVPAPVPTKAKPAPPSAPATPAAIDPSVHIGDNVHIGPGVVIGGAPATPTTPPPTPASRSSVSQPADYNAKRFDPIAYLPKALALARQLIPDAKLTSFEFDPVFPDGHVDLTMDGHDREYRFRSPSKSARPADMPRNLPFERPCMVYIEVGAREVTAKIRTSEDCDAKLVRHPSCKLAGVWKQALANGTPTDVVARVGWLFDEKWFFDVDLEGKGGGVSTFADRCP